MPIHLSTLPILEPTRHKTTVNQTAFFNTSMSLPQCDYYYNFFFFYIRREQKYVQNNITCYIGNIRADS